MPAGEVPTYADAILVLSKEWTGFALAYAYGQTVPGEEIFDLLEFNNFYRAELAEEGLDESEDRASKRG